MEKKWATDSHWGAKEKLYPRVVANTAGRRSQERDLKVVGLEGTRGEGDFETSRGRGRWKNW